MQPDTLVMSTQNRVLCTIEPMTFAPQLGIALASGDHLARDRKGQCFIVRTMEGPSLAKIGHAPATCVQVFSVSGALVGKASGKPGGCAITAHRGQFISLGLVRTSRIFGTIEIEEEEDNDNADDI
jgi:hypothetical protein